MNLVSMCSCSFLSLVFVLSQATAVLDNCVLTNARSHTFIMWVEYMLIWTMLTDPLAVRHVKVIFIITSLTVFFSQCHHYDCWRIVWNGGGGCDTHRHFGNMENLQTISMERTDTHTFTGWTKYVVIMLQDNSQIQISGLMRFGYFSHIYPTNKSWSLSDLHWQWLLLRWSCHWYVNTLIAVLWLTKYTRFWEYVTCSYLLHCPANSKSSLPLYLFLHLFRTGELESGLADVD